LEDSKGKVWGILGEMEKDICHGTRG
jgi:hypothetical protein